MAETMSLQFLIDAQDNTKVALQSAQRGIDKLQGKVKSLGPTFKKMALIGTASFATIGAGVWKATQNAVNAQEIFNKFDTVFDDVGNKAEEVAMDLRNNWGLAESSAKDLLSSTGDLLSGFGFTGEAALDLSEQTQKLAIDLASFTNLQGGAERASGILTKALLGEKDSLVALGIKILDSDVNQRLLAEGKGELEGLALRQAKAEITLQLAIEQSGKAIGDYERTSESAANKQRELKERIKELSEKIGMTFIPILEEVIEKVMPVIEQTAKWVEENPKLTKGIIIAVAALAGLIAILGVIGLVIPVMLTALGLLGGAIGLLLSPIGLVILAIGAFILIGKKLIDDWEVFKESLKVIWDALVVVFNNVWDSIAEYLGNIWIGMENAVSGSWENIKQTILSGINWAIDKINYFIRQANKVAGMVPGMTMISEIAHLAKGGIVTKPTVALIGEAGPEAVIPLSDVHRSGGAGGTYITNVYVQGGNYLSEEAGEIFGEYLADELKRNQKL